ncbi:MAG: hypothetical protein K6C95_06350 [Lachnospiraceae bacterium]|nr:hypothetical protein [Lachnospiraceae bacterium]
MSDLLSREYYCGVNMERYIAAIIDTMNRGESMQNITKPAPKIREMVDMYNEREPL